MAHDAMIQVRLDSDLKRASDDLFVRLGLDTPTAIRMFLSQAVYQHGIPFNVSIDPFYSEENLAALRRSIRELEEGKVVVKSMEDLEAMET